MTVIAAGNEGGATTMHGASERRQPHELDNMSEAGGDFGTEPAAGSSKAVPPSDSEDETEPEPAAGSSKAVPPSDSEDETEPAKAVAPSDSEDETEPAKAVAPSDSEDETEPAEGPSKPVAKMSGVSMSGTAGSRASKIQGLMALKNELAELLSMVKALVVRSDSIVDAILSETSEGDDMDIDVSSPALA